MIKKEIIKAAVEIIIVKGFSNTSLTDVANSIGISKPALYWHFKNKDELFSEVINYVRAEYLEKLREISKQESMNAYEKLLQIIGFSYQKTFDDLNICVLPMKMLVEFSNKNNNFGAILREFYADGIEIIKGFWMKASRRKYSKRILIPGALPCVLLVQWMACFINVSCILGAIQWRNAMSNCFLRVL